MEKTSIEFILLLAIVLVVVFDRFLNNSLLNSNNEPNVLIGYSGQKKIKTKTKSKALIYIVISILLLIAVFIPKSLNLSLINNTGLSSIEILFWVLIHLLVIYYCYSTIRDKLSIKKVIAKEILFLFIMITTSVVAYLATISFNENYEVILEESSLTRVSMKRINLRGHRQYYRLAGAIPKCADFNDIDNPIILKFNSNGRANFIEKYSIINVNTASSCDNFRYTFEYLNKYIFRWGNHPYNQLFSFFWKINLSQSIADSFVGIVIYIGILFRGLLFFLYGMFRINKWAINTLKD